MNDILIQQAIQKEKDRQLKKYEIDTKAKTEIDKVTLAAIGAEGSYSQDSSTIDQLLAQKDFDLRENDINSKNIFEDKVLPF